MAGSIEVRVTPSASEEDVIQLYREAGWWDAKTADDNRIVKNIISDSALFAGAFDGEKLVGMGRALSDGVSDAYIQDVIVLERYRRKGLGRDIVQTLVQGLKQKGIDWIGLVAEPGTAYFYKSLGFEPMEGYTPLKYKGRI